LEQRAKQFLIFIGFQAEYHFQQLVLIGAQGCMLHSFFNLKNIKYDLLGTK
jgi:hypothetical protein